MLFGAISVAAVNLWGAAISIQTLEKEGEKTYHNLLRKTSLCEFLAAISYILCGIVRSLRTATKNYVHIRITLI